MKSSLRPAIGWLRRLGLAQRRSLLMLCLGLAGVAMSGVLAVTNSRVWDVDFNQYYSAGKLAGSGDLYNWEAIRALELQRNEKAVPFGAFRLLPSRSSRSRRFPILWRARCGFAPALVRWPGSWPCGRSPAGGGLVLRSAGRCPRQCVSPLARIRSCLCFS